MAGCYGNSREDRYFEAMCDKHTDQGEETCNCEVTYTDDNNNLIIDGEVTTKEDIVGNDNFCRECGAKFNINEWF